VALKDGLLSPADALCAFEKPDDGEAKGLACAEPEYASDPEEPQVPLESDGDEADESGVAVDGVDSGVTGRRGEAPYLFKC